jgi:KDO2-lipid IV(A) lauroyltransferase
LPVSTVLGRLLGFFAYAVVRVRRREVLERIRDSGIPDADRVAAAFYGKLGGRLLRFLGERPRIVLEDSLLAALDGARPFADASEFPGSGVARDGGPTKTGARPFATASENAAGGVARDGGPTLREGDGGPGIVVAAAHLGNWEHAAAAAARWASEQNRPFAVVAKPLSSPFFQRWLTARRAALGVATLPPAGAFLAARDLLAKGGVVALLIDQVPDGRSGAPQIPFLGRDAYADLFPAMLAARTGARLVQVAVLEQNVGDERLVLLDATGPGTTDRGALVARTARLFSHLEAFIRREPTSWLWLHRRWRAPKGLPPVGVGNRLVSRPSLR